MIFSEEQQSSGMGISVIEKAVIDTSKLLIEPYSYPEGEALYLVPVEFPECCYEHKIIVPAFYEATCQKSRRYIQKGCHKLCLTWSFFLAGCAELTLPQHFNVAEKFKMTFSYPKQWILANGGQYPSRLTLDRMSPKLFHDKSALILVRFACPRNPDGTKAHDALRYPVVGQIQRMINLKDSQP